MLLLLPAAKALIHPQATFSVVIGNARIRSLLACLSLVLSANLQILPGARWEAVSCSVGASGELLAPAVPALDKISPIRPHQLALQDFKGGGAHAGAPCPSPCAPAPPSPGLHQVASQALRTLNATARAPPASLGVLGAAPAWERGHRFAVMSHDGAHFGFSFKPSVK